MDKKLRDFAQLIASPHHNYLTTSEMHYIFFQRFWNKESTDKILSIYENYMKNSEDSNRQINKCNGQKSIDDFIFAGEKLILDWKG